MKCEILLWFAIGALTIVIYFFLPRAAAQCVYESDRLILQKVFLVLGAICLVMGLWNLLLRDKLARQFLTLGVALLTAKNIVKNRTNSILKEEKP